MSRETLLAAVITTSQPPLDQQMRAAHAADADLVELRVDRIGDVEAVRNALAQSRPIPIIITVRSSAEGGAWSAGESARVALLFELAALRPEYLDIEFVTWQQQAALRSHLDQLGCTSATLRLAPATPGSADPPRLIISTHDFGGTPTDPYQTLQPLAVTPAFAIKGAFNAGDVRDAFRVLAATRRLAAHRRVIGLSMGYAGQPARILSAKFGSFLDYAPLYVENASAPGQLTIDELKQYNWEHIGSATRVLGVIGWPVTHSLSPALHNAAMRAADIAGVFLPLPVMPEYDHLASFLDLVSGDSFRDLVGCSVTLPHKEHALRWLDEQGASVSDVARRAGAVNTLTRTDSGWRGDNTDVVGLEAALADHTPLAGRHVTLLGAGGMARAAALALSDAGCHITIYGRSEDRARKLADLVGCEQASWEQRDAQGGDLLVNCTPVGMWPNSDECPVSAEAVRPGLVVVESIYRPRETALIKLARERGCRVVDGEAIFIGQAAAQYANWHGCPMSIPDMTRAFEAIRPSE